jgi:hypothetical protein
MPHQKYRAAVFGIKLKEHTKKRAMKGSCPKELTVLKKGYNFVRVCISGTSSKVWSK